MSFCHSRRLGRFAWTLERLPTGMPIRSLASAIVDGEIAPALGQCRLGAGFFGGQGPMERGGHGFVLGRVLTWLSTYGAALRCEAWNVDLGDLRRAERRCVLRRALAFCVIVLGAVLGCRPP